MDECALLENAAKAIGFMAWKNKADAWQLYDGEPDDGDGKYIRFWNPLKYDADALQLATKLNMMVDIKEPMVNVFCRNKVRVQIVHGEDFSESVREAIVTTAALIGQGDGSE